MALPLFKNNDQTLQLLQTQWKGQLDPLIAVPLTSGRVLKNIPLLSGLNVINHQLGAVLQGWFLVRKRQWLTTGTPTVYDVSDTQDNNSMPALTLQLYCTQGTSGNPALVDLWVY